MKEIRRKGKIDLLTLVATLLIIVCTVLILKIAPRKDSVEEPTDISFNAETEHESGYLIRYLDKQVVMVSIRVPKDAPEKEFNEWFVAAKVAIEGADKKITHTVPLKSIGNSTEKGITIKKFVIIVQPIEPNTPL